MRTAQSYAYTPPHTQTRKKLLHNNKMTRTQLRQGSALAKGNNRLGQRVGDMADF
jgi:hypothetical protein